MMKSLEIEIAEEKRRILVFLETVERPLGENPLQWANGLANHLVRNRVQAAVLEQANLEALVEAAREVGGYQKDPILRERHMARWILRRRVLTGAIMKKPCEVCGGTTVHGHHTDYAKPLDVVWLCPTHHRERHAPYQKKAGGG